MTLLVLAVLTVLLDVVLVLTGLKVLLIVVLAAWAMLLETCLWLPLMLVPLLGYWCSVDRLGVRPLIESVGAVRPVR